MVELPSGTKFSRANPGLSRASLGNWPGVPVPGSLLPPFEAPPYLTSWPIYAYGASYSTLDQAFHTAGAQWMQLLAGEAGGGAVTSYGVNGRRALDVAAALMNTTGGLVGITGPAGTAALVSGSTWPGTSNRSGLVVFDQLGNDAMNQAAHNTGSITVQAITGGLSGTYMSYLKQTWRAAFAFASSETRIENASHSATSGVWTHDAVGSWASGGFTCFTTANGAWAEYSVTPPQQGPLAGKVWVIIAGDIASPNNWATLNWQVDGGATTSVTTNRVTYVGFNGSTVRAAINAIPITLPVDGNAHTIRLTHTGIAGEFMIIDCVLVGSETPNPFLAMGCEHPLTTNAAAFDATDLTLFKQNMQLITPGYQSVVAEFANGIYVPSTITSNGVYSGDGLHPNDRGMQERKNDAMVALRTVLPRLRNRYLQQQADSGFAVI